MRDVFPEEAVEGRSAPEFAANEAEASRIRDGLEAHQVCPFCGAVGDGSESLCPKCSMENNAAARKATKLRIGPWYVLQNRNPAAPGMKWETLLSFVRKGRVKPQSVVRGPTTHQLWRFAAHVKGLSREFGVCYSCGGSVERGGNLCPHCNRLQEPPIHPDTLLEGSEPESRGPVFREIAGAASEQVLAAASVSAELDADMKEKLRQADEVLRERREQGDAADQARQEVQRDREAAARDREAAQRERETAMREREAVDREKEAIERDRLALARDRETARREREVRGQMSDRGADVAGRQSGAPKRDTAVWELSEPEARREIPVQPVQKPLPATEKPVGAGARGRTAPRDGGFLSAKDLAAAFKLNHQMAVSARERKAMADDDSAGDDSASRFKPIAPGSRRGSRRSGGKLFLVLVLLVWIVGGAWVLKFHPAWRAQAMAWWSRASQSISPNAPVRAPGAALPDKADEPPAPTPADSVPEGLAPGTLPSDTQPANLSQTPQTAPAAIIPPSSIPSPSPQPTTAPAQVVPPASVSASPPPTLVTPATAPSPAPAPITPPSPVPAPVPLHRETSPPSETPPPTTAESPAPAPLDAKAQAKLLYSQAKEAEFRGDLAEAARLYQEIIEKLPTDSWPSDVELRLKLAKVQLKQK